MIHDGGVGDARVGERLPPWLLAPESRPVARHVTGFYADAQTLEGFRWPGQPVRILMEAGPFSRWFEDPKRKSGGVPPPAVAAQLARQGVAAARAGARVAWIVVDGSGPRTASGIGVGSTLAEVARAHPGARLRPQPPTLGKDECAAVLAPLRHVQVYFATCRGARAGGPVTRVTIFGDAKK